MVKNPPDNAGDPDEIRGTQKDSLEKEPATHSSYSCLGNPLNKGAWWAMVHGVTKRFRHSLVIKQQMFAYIYISSQNSIIRNKIIN